MLEQEKAVQFRFESSEKSFSENLVEIGLPAYARLYSCVGLPNIFGWQNVEKAESFQETWLFIPDHALESILSSHRKDEISGDKHLPLSNSFRLNNHILYPVHRAGKVCCVVAIPEEKEFNASLVDFESLAKINISTGPAEKSSVVHITYEFVSRLFNCKQNYSEFAQRLLNFLTDQVDKSYAGLYWKGADGYHRRWSHGDLQLSEKLPLDVSAETVESWKDHNSRGKTFIPAELVQDEPAFVQSAPNFLFVYQSPNFGDREQWLVMAVPGDISTAAIARMTIIASLLESLDDERLTGYSDLVEMFNGLLDKNHKSLSLDDALKSCFKFIDGKLRLKSISLLDTDHSVIRCTRIAENRLSLVKTRVPIIPDQALKVIENFEPAFFNGPAYASPEERKSANDGSVSHALFPVPILESGTALLSVEFEGPVERARHFQHLFEMTAKYLGVSMSLTKAKTGEPKVVDAPANDITQTIALARFRTLSNLNGGYFHELIEYLSVILGQAEIMEYDIKRTQKSLAVEDLLVSTDRIVRAAGSLARRLEELKEVSTIQAIDSGHLITAERFLNMLPAMIYGYYLTVKDDKNVEIEVQTKSDKNVSFSIPVLHVYDFILPLIMAIMDQALCSGKVVVSVAEHFGRPVLRIAYPKKLSGKLPPEKLFYKVFKYCQSQKGDNGEMLITADEARFILSDCQSDRHQVIYSFTGHIHPIDEHN